MRFSSLSDWLSWQEGLSPRTIDLGLERVGRVLQRAGHHNQFNCPLVIVAGTNGKGSVVAYLEAIALAGGHRVCSYTSPHLLRYNERIRIDGSEIDDAALCNAFERIDQARGDEPLTYFEFGTLAAIDLFFNAAPDLVVMEIGLGGRLDAVNIMEPDVAVVTTVALDHCDWLGPDRESIGYEKAGVFRTGRPAVCGDSAPPQSLLHQAAKLGVVLKLIGRDFRIERDAESWRYVGADAVIGHLPIPPLAGEFQLDNAATAITALKSLAGFDTAVAAIRLGLRRVHLAGRFQLIRQHPDVIVDVAHNSQAAAALASLLRQKPANGRTVGIVAMLADKPVADVVASLADEIDCWYAAGLKSVARGLPAGEMAAVVEQHNADGKLHSTETVTQACAQALTAVEGRDRIIIFGSFYTAAEALQFFAHQR